MRAALAKSRRRARPATLRDAHVPAPVGGLNTQAAGSAMPPEDAVAIWNLVSSELGLRSRLGYREWAVGLTGLADNLVRSVLPYSGSAKNGSKNRLFACTSTGIWDVTDRGAIAPAWAGATAYEVGAFVTSNGNVYGATFSGTSHATAGLPETWTALTAYVIGDRVINGGNVYVCDTNGTSDAAGGPTGEAANIVDATTRWDFQSTSDAISDGTVIWRYRTSNIAPTLVLTFGIQTGEAGIGACHAMVTAAGHFLLYCDEENGYHVYTESTDAWAAVTLGAGGTQVSGVDPANFVHVNVWKSRVWFTEKDSAKAWYLAAGTIYGAATQLPLAQTAFFRSGGSLRGLWSWTLDGGVGLDDHLVAVSDGGDVAIYQGSDPASASTFALIGSWSIGGLPAGRRIATTLGGDLLLLTKSGLRPMSQLVAGGEGSGVFLTGKVAALINQQMLTTATLFGWSLQLHPEDNALILTVPTSTGQPLEQVAQQIWNRSWSRYRDLPMYSAATWAGKLFFGTTDGRVCVNDGYLDNVRLADSSNVPVQWAMITAFRNLESARMKRLHLIRPTILSDAPFPNFTAQARYRYDLSELPSVSGGTTAAGGWDAGLFDEAIWGGEYSASQQLRGATGCGVDVAIAMRGEAAGRTVIVGIDVGYSIGGVL